MQAKFKDALGKFEYALQTGSEVRGTCMQVSIDLDRFKGNPVADGARKKLALASEALEEGLRVRGCGAGLRWGAERVGGWRLPVARRAAHTLSPVLASLLPRCPARSARLRSSSRARRATWTPRWRRRSCPPWPARWTTWMMR